MRIKKDIKCKKCGDMFKAVRSDAKHCLKCHRKRISDWSKRPENVDRKLLRYKLLRKAVIDGYGGKCDCCGEKQIEFLAIDHVNGGGQKERKTKSIGQIMKKIIREDFPEEYRVLCHNCNSSIGFYGYCPHKRTA